MVVGGREEAAKLQNVIEEEEEAAATVSMNANDSLDGFDIDDGYSCNDISQPVKIEVRKFTHPLVVHASHRSRVKALR